MSEGTRRVLLTGATGYVDGRLLTSLASRGEQVRCLARDPARLLQRLPPGVEVARGDVINRASLAEAFAGVDCRLLPRAFPPRK